MKTVLNPPKSDLPVYLKRPIFDSSKIEKIVKPILEKVKRGGDKALYKFALEYDQVSLDTLFVAKEELESAHLAVDDQLKDAINQARKNIATFHESQKQSELVVETMPGVTCRRRSVAIEKVGLYIPGGTAPLFSTVLMLGVPAIIAGCKEIILATPTNKSGQVNPVILYTANLLGIDKVLKLGGAQAVAAMAYGTESVPRVDKIFGPGNQYVTTAKQLVSKDMVAIDMPAGPSEVCVMADEKADPAFVAADLLSQAEHGIDSQVLLVTDSEKFAIAVDEEVEKQVSLLPRKEMTLKALENSYTLVINNQDELLEVVNDYAPEHLIINMGNADEVADKIINAGSIFIGPYTPESAGDYASGTNHTLPTNGWAASMAGVSLDSFVKKITYQKITKKGLLNLGPVVETMAEAERLHAHKNAVSIRLKSIRDGKD